MYTFLKAFLLHGRRFSRVVTYNEREFFGFYKNCQLEIRQHGQGPAQWAIDVRHPDGGTLYDGFHRCATIEAAIAEAIKGACIK